MKFNPIESLEGITFEDYSIVYDENKYELIKVVGENVGTADFYRFPCDTPELAGFLFLLNKFDFSVLLIDVGPQLFDEIETIVVNDNEVYIDENVDELDEPDHDGYPMVLIEPVLIDCNKKETLSFVTAAIYEYYLYDLLVLPSGYKVPVLESIIEIDSDDAQSTENRKKQLVLSIYKSALAAGRTSVSDGPRGDARMSFGIACPNCRFFYWENSGEICHTHLVDFPDLIDINPEVIDLQLWFKKAVLSLSADQQNIDLSIKLLLEVSSSLEFDDEDQLEELLECLDEIELVEKVDRIQAFAKLHL